MGVRGGAERCRPEGPAFRNRLVPVGINAARPLSRLLSDGEAGSLHVGLELAAVQEQCPIVHRDGWMIEGSCRDAEPLCEVPYGAGRRSEDPGGHLVADLDALTAEGAPPTPPKKRQGPEIGASCWKPSRPPAPTARPCSRPCATRACGRGGARPQVG